MPPEKPGKRMPAAEGRGVNRPADASLFIGGLFAQLLRRAGVNERTLERLRVALVFALPLIAWLPLLVLTGVNGTLLPGRVGAPFMLDLSAHLRLLVALPLFLFAGVVASARLLPTLQQFTIRGLVPDASRERFEAAITSAFRLGNSAVADVVILILIYSVDTLVVRRNHDAFASTTWLFRALGPGATPTPAATWYAIVSLPIFEFVLLRWYYRLVIWARFLAQVAKLRLRLVPTNPDRMGGLGFLLLGTQAFAVFAMAHGALLAGWLSTRVLVRDMPLTEFKLEIAAVVVFVLCITILPLLFFTVPLMRTKRRGVLEYGALATRYAREFDDKWVRSKDAGEPLVGSADVQSLADMGGSYDLVRSMRNVPVTFEMVLEFAGLTLVPVAPLLLTLMPLSEILNKLVGILF